MLLSFIIFLFLQINYLRIINFSLGDFLPQCQSKNKNKNKNSRRINPTQVSSSSDSKFEPTYFSGHKDNFLEERALLKKHRNTEQNNSNIRLVESPKFHFNHLFLQQEDITNRLALDIFSEVHSILCMHNLVQDKLCEEIRLEMNVNGK